MRYHGTVEPLPSGRFRARKKNASGKYQSVGTFDSREEAELALQRPLTESKGKGISLAEFGDGFLVRRRNEVRDWENNERYWRLYVVNESIAKMPMRKLDRWHIKDWVGSLAARGLSAQTQRNALNLVRVSLTDAVDRRIIPTNPARDVKLSRRSEDEGKAEKWEILYPHEQLSLLGSVHRDEWHTVAFALGTGLRNTEQWNLRVSDFDLESREVVVRGLTKSGRTRRIPLFGVALDAAQEALDRVRKGSPWVFPSPRSGQQRAAKSHPSRWHDWRVKAGIVRSIRWYDLRHTCATSLLAGWWGKQWTLSEISQLLGHSSTKMTERYAHRLNETLKRAAEGTGFHGVGFHGETGIGSNSRATFGIRTRDLRFTNPRVIEGFSGLAVEEYHKRSTARDGQASGKLLEASRLLYRSDKLAKARIRQLLAETAEVLGL